MKNSRVDWLRLLPTFLILFSFCFSIPLLTATVSEATIPAPDESSIAGRVIAPLPFKDDAGRPRTLDLFQGQPVVVLPVFTRCHGSCSRMATGLKKALIRLNLDPRTYQVFLFSFDPDDTIGDLREFRRQFALPAFWTLGRLERKDLRELTSALDYRVARGSGEWIHPDVAFVIGPDRSIARVLRGPAFAATGDAPLLEALASTRQLATWKLRYGPYVFAFSTLLLISSAIAVSLAFTPRRSSA